MVILRRKLDAIMSYQPIDETVASELILKIADAEYRKIGNSAYETEKIRRLLKEQEYIDALDCEILEKCISKIIVSNSGAVSILLTNGQSIQGGGL